MQHDGNLEIRPFRAHFSARKGHKDNSSFRTTIKMYQYPNTSTRILIHPDQIISKIKLIAIDLKRTQYALKTHTTTYIIWKIPMVKLTLFMHMNSTSYKILKRRSFLNM